MMNSLAGVVYDTRYLDHRISKPSKECPERVRALYEQLAKTGSNLNARRYSPKWLDDSKLFGVHSPFYIEQIAAHTAREDPFSYDKDSYVMQETLSVARLAAGGCVVLADAIMEEEIGRGFSLIRPPGHHATSGRGMGFCILNNISIVAQYLLDTYGLQRIMILDFDVHHANGTQEIFYESDKVLLISLHRKTLFPFTGGAEEVGEGAGLGYTINIPVQSQFGDTEYSHLFGRLVLPAAEQFLPQIILVSAGYDAHIDDTISDTSLTTDGYREITETLKYLASEVCDGRLLFILEGGYNPTALESSVMATIEALTNSSLSRPGFRFSARAQKLLDSTIPDDIKNRWGM